MIRVALFALVATSCSHPASPPMHTNDCTAAIAGFASGDAARFHPLPTTCTLADVQRTLRSLDTTTRGTLAHRTNPMTIHWFASERLPEIHAWFDPGGHLVLLDADNPPGSAEAFTAALGPPDHRLDYPWHASTIANGELLWLARGVVVIADAGAKVVRRVGVFAPTTLEAYQANVQFADTEDVDEG
jgi:hypothetical protein